jgi:hypothetical protein
MPERMLKKSPFPVTLNTLFGPRRGAFCQETIALPGFPLFAILHYSAGGGGGAQAVFAFLDEIRKKKILCVILTMSF